MPGGVVSPDEGDNYFLVADETRVGQTYEDLNALGIYLTINDGYVDVTTDASLGVELGPDDVVLRADEVLTMGGSGHDVLYGLDSEVTRDVLFGGEGSDYLRAYGGLNEILGGQGSDTFIVDAKSQTSVILGDVLLPDGYTLPDWDGVGPVPDFDYQTLNDSFGDEVWFDWSLDDSVIDRIAGHANGYRIEHTLDDGSLATVDVYDVETLIFRNDDGSFQEITNPNLSGEVIGREHWFGEASGMDISVNDVQFDVQGNQIQVHASWTSVETTMVEGWSWKGKFYEGAQPHKKAKAATEEHEAEVAYDDHLIWSGSRLEVMGFEFSDSFVNVINGTGGDPLTGVTSPYITGTNQMDLFVGTDQADYIDAGAGDDLVFAGDGDDVLVGGLGEDVLLGGAGNDIIRGDAMDEVAATYFSDDLELVDMTGSDDVIIGGAGIDDIATGGGRDVAVTDTGDLNGDGVSDIDKYIDEETKRIIDDNDWA
jgi:Ca2+-binding RTX toxin-like protein